MRTAASTKLPEFTNSDQTNNNLKSKTFDKSKNSELLSPFVKSEKAKKNLSTSNNSTLSLHIVAYENSFESGGSNNQNNSDESIAKVQKNSDIGKKWKNSKQIFTESTSVKTSIEIPRQQKEEKAVKSEPEIMQFKASQKLLHPNQPQQQQQSKKKCESKKVEGNPDNMDTSISSEMAQNRQKINHCRIMQVLSTSTEHFQRIFKERWLEYQKLKKNVSNKWNNSTEDRLQLIKLCPTATSQMKESFKTDNIELWDITLLNHAIQALRSGGAVNKLEDTVINCIRETRNKIVHGKPELSDEEFQKHFNQLSTFMIKLGDTQSSMDELKNSLMKLGETKVEQKTQNVKSEFKKLKDEANKLFQAKKYNEAIDVYNRILEISGLPRDDQACSAAYFSLKTKDSYLLAKRHADFAVQLRPIWWRGYFRLGKAEHVLGNLREAEKALKDAIALEPGSDEIRDELGAVAAKLDYHSREEYLNPDDKSESYEKWIEKRLRKTGMTEKEYNEAYGDMDAINGDRWRMGYKGQQDSTKAVEYYVKSAKKNNPSSMVHLGEMYRYGKGIEINYKEAVRWLKKAAESKDIFSHGSSITSAQNILGYLYYTEEGVKKDYSEAYKWHKKAADNGCASSSNILGDMYVNGYGVEQSPQKAFQYFQCAAYSGDTSAMQNLAESYFKGHGTPTGFPTEDDVAEGIKWLKAAFERGDCRAQRRLEEVTNMKSDELIKESIKDSDQMTARSNPLDQQLFSGRIKEAASKGSISAQRLVEIWKQLNIATDAAKRKDFEGVIAALSKAIRIDRQIVLFPDFFKPIIMERHKVHPNDLDTVTCYVKIMLDDKNELKIINEKLEMFPTDEYLLHMKVSVYLRAKDLKNALAASQKAIEVHSNSPSIIFLHGFILFSQKPRMKDFIKFLDDFLAVAPYDHPKVPTCHYLKAVYYHEVNDISKFKASFEAGLATEKQQLPCFLPYKFTGRERLKLLYAAQNYKDDSSKNKNLAPSDPFSLQENLEKVKTNPRRIHLHIQHLQEFIHHHQRPKGIEYVEYPNWDVSRPPDLFSLKKIMLKDILLDGQKKIFEGFVLKARVIDWSIPLITPAVLIQDENGDVERLHLFGPKSTKNINFKREIEAVMKRYRPGVTLSIINPHMTETPSNNQNVIRVENEAHIIVDDSDADERCSCCGRKTEVLLCAKCKMSRYCSKDCQQYDWNELDHKSVCRLLKKYK